jgi:phospholipid/cholesterol/gamma-HCH transport system ATP-binding protein
MIQIEHLSKSFAGRPVLRDVSLEIHEGETFAVIGRSGSGKSVLLKHIIGLLDPDEGRVLVDDVDPHALPYDDLRRLRRKFGVLFQGGALFDSMTALENVMFPISTFTDLTKPEARDRALECLRMVNLPDVGPKKPNELSGGMQKRVALARAIALEPKYILYDEPTSGLDPQTSETINELINSLAGSLGATSIVITHDMHSVLAIADRAGYLYEGRMHWVGTMEDLHCCADEATLDFVKASEYTIGR